MLLEFRSVYCSHPFVLDDKVFDGSNVFCLNNNIFVVLYYYMQA
jgi:hypothetical protein